MIERGRRRPLDASQPDAAALIAELDRVRRRLYARLRSADARLLAKRPAPGDWSIIENVRHLLFAEQAHLAEFLPAKVSWSHVGLTQRTGRAFKEVGAKPTNDLEEVLGAWDAVHRPIRRALKSADGDVAYTLGRHLKHFAHHAGIIEKLLRASAR